MFRLNPLRLRRLAYTRGLPVLKFVAECTTGIVVCGVGSMTLMELKNYALYPNESLPFFQGRVDTQDGKTCLYHAAANIAAFNTAWTDYRAVDFPLSNQRIYDQIKDWSYLKLYFNLSKVPEMPEVYFVNLMFSRCTNQVNSRRFQDALSELKRDDGVVNVVCMFPYFDWSICCFTGHAVAVSLVKPPHKDPFLIVMDSGNIDLKKIDASNPWILRSYGRSFNYVLKHITKAYTNA